MLQSEIDYFLAQAIEEDQLAAVATDQETQGLHRGFAAVFRKCATRALIEMLSAGPLANGQL